MIGGLTFKVFCKAYTHNAAFSKGPWYRKKRRDEVKAATQAALEKIRFQLTNIFDGFKPIPIVHFTFEMEYKRQGNFCDTDAVGPMKKAVIDTLVKNGVILDDTGDIVKSVKYYPPTGGHEFEGLRVWVLEKEEIRNA